MSAGAPLPPTRERDERRRRSLVEEPRGALNEHDAVGRALAERMDAARSEGPSAMSEGPAPEGRPSVMSGGPLSIRFPECCVASTLDAARVVLVVSTGETLIGTLVRIVCLEVMRMQFVIRAAAIDK